MVRCELCLQTYPEGTLFCDTCGTSLEPDLAMPTPLTPGFGFVTPTIRVPQDATPAIPIQVEDAAPPPADPMLAALGDDLFAPPPPPIQRRAVVRRVRLRMTNGKSFEVSGEGVFVIGRRDAAMVDVPALDFADHNGAACGVSRRHAAIHIRPDGVFVEDLESRNETIHNGYRLMSRQLYPLADGDELRLGTILLLVALD